MTTPVPLPSPLLPLASPDADLETVGGKAMNLAKLAIAGFRIPNGFFIPTTCYRDFVAENNLRPLIQKILNNTSLSSPEGLKAASDEIRAEFTRGNLSPTLASSLEIGYRWLGEYPVAVRSSATAEDLPGISFAGQHDTFLNITCVELLRDAVIQCWSSLWTARAISYRAHNNIPHEDISLSIVVQTMVPSFASGVLFTANPLTGSRTECVIDATLGLGEALVGGHVEPDHYSVAINDGAIPDDDDSLTIVITHRSLGSKSMIITGKEEGGVVTRQVGPSHHQAIPDEAIIRLARIGHQINKFYNFPQDIEWAYLPLPPGDAEDQTDIFILQSRPITSLFPLPEALGINPPKIFIGFHLVQGIFEPITPLGQDTMKLVLTGGGRVFKLGHTLETQTAFYSAGERLWINLTSIIRSPIGNKVLPRVVKAIGPDISVTFRTLTNDPRFKSTDRLPRLSTLRRLAGFFLPFLGQVLRNLRNPDRMRTMIFEAFDSKVAETRDRIKPTDDIWNNFTQRLELLHQAELLFSEFVIPMGIPPVVAGMAMFFGILERFSQQVAKATGNPELNSQYLEIARGLPNNVTTEMDLILWQTSKTMRSDPQSLDAFKTATAEELAAAYLDGSLPVTAQEAIAVFMGRYGARGPGEIDIGRSRWRENPTHVMNVLQSYLKIEEPDMAPDVVFERGAQAANASAEELIKAVRKLPGGAIKARLVRFAVSRYRALGGLREAPKFFAIRMMGIIRQGLLLSGQEFVESDELQSQDDFFFLYIKELDEIAENRKFTPELIQRICERRALREREMMRKQIPRILLSDGTAYYEGIADPDGGSHSLLGDPVSPGLVEGKVRVILDPHQTQLEPGEIIVCPGTDPAWTPLFLAAGGLVMEVGGMMTHGSVVAREYGIPAVVGVSQATIRLTTGQPIRLNGTTGLIELLD